MPTGPGALDANGIWQFGEDDSESLASDLLNLGMESVSDAVADLQDQIDNLVIPSTAGLEHLYTQDFSGATTHTFGTAASPIFDTDYKNFKIIISELAGATANTTMYARLTADGVADTSTNHEYQYLNAISATVSAGKAASQTWWDIGVTGYISTEPNPIELLVMNPNQAKRTAYFSDSLYIESYQGTRYLKRAGVNYTSSAFDGLQILAAYNISGRISVYGYRES